MKKVLSIVAVAALSAAFVSCGPSKEEIEAKEKAKADSIAAVAQAQADSLAKVAAEAEAKVAAEAAHVADSLKAVHEADSLAHLKGGKKK